MFEQEQLTGMPPGMAGQGLSLGLLPPRQDPVAAARTQAANRNLSEDQLRMAMPLLAANGMHPNFAAGLHAGMQYHHPHLAAGGYNPAFYHAMMSGMGVPGAGLPPPAAGAIPPPGATAAAATATTAAAAPPAPVDEHLGKEVVTKEEAPAS